MNRNLLFMFFLILPTNASSATKHVSSSFEYMNNLKFGAKYEIEVKQTGVRLNGLQISDLSVMRLYPQISRVLQIKNNAVAFRCPAGHYKHTVKRDSKIVTATGCIGDTHFAEVISAFTTLEKTSLRKRKVASQ